MPHHGTGRSPMWTRVTSGSGSAMVPARSSRPLTPSPLAGEEWRHGGLSVSSDGAWALAVRETHATTGPSPRRSIVAIGVNAVEPTESTLLAGRDFFGAARLDEASARVVATAWDHPDMPWDVSSIVITDLARIPDAPAAPERLTSLREPWTIDFGADRRESVGQPWWRKDGSLVFVSDREGWWQPYVHAGRDDGRPPQRLTTAQAEFHGPDWNLGQRTIAELADGNAGRPDDGRRPRQPCGPGQSTPHVGTPRTRPAVRHHFNGHPSPWWCRLHWRDAGPADRRVRDGPSRGRVRPHAHRATITLASNDVAAAEPIHLSARTGRPIYANLYRPTLSGTVGRADHRPPLLVFCHSGPTTAAQQGFDPAVQFFTTRGFAVVTPNYAGSTGYGRAYREALNGQWGIADAHDCLDTALSLAQTDVDPTRMADPRQQRRRAHRTQRAGLGRGFCRGRVVVRGHRPAQPHRDDARL